jgi:pimeloyl-ACP methyl ester carboxylesterase
LTARDDGRLRLRPRVRYGDDMPIARVGDLDLCWEDFGDAEARPLLLIMGLASQMIHWDEELCRALADRGHRVIRFDNRDVGQSSTLAAHGMPDVLGAYRAAAAHEPVASAYTLADMAADAAGLLDALGIASAHVVGASMGGMIAQTMAIRHPARVRSLTSIMSTTGHPSLPPATPDATAALLAPVAHDRDAAIDRAAGIFRTIGSPGFPFDEAYVRARAARAFDRGHDPAGPARQLVAILASGHRRHALRDVTAPTLVVHGTDDPLVPVEGGIDTAQAVPGAELLLIDGMGHDLPHAVWPRLVDAISALTARADAGR